MTQAYLKRKEGAAADWMDKIQRKPDNDNFDTVDAICHDVMHGIETKDIRILKSAIQALIDHIQTLDEQQDSTQQTQG